MAKLTHAASFRDLVVYQKAKAVSHAIFEASKSFPRDETYSLTDQMRRASRSIGAQIAEAWAKRRYERHFISKLSDADAEQMETQHWFSEARDCHYMDPQKAKNLLMELEEIGRMLNSMMEKSQLFCNEHPDLIREAAEEYILEKE